MTDRRTFLKSVTAFAIQMTYAPQSIVSLAEKQIQSVFCLSAVQRSDLLTTFAELTIADESANMQQLGITERCEIQIVELMIEKKHSVGDLSKYRDLALRAFHEEQSTFQGFIALFRRHLSAGSLVLRLLNNYKSLLKKNRRDPGELFLDAHMHGWLSRDGDYEDELGIKEEARLFNELADQTCSECCQIGFSQDEARVLGEQIQDLTASYEHLSWKYINPDEDDFFMPEEWLEEFFDGIREGVRDSGGLEHFLKKAKSNFESTEKCIEGYQKELRKIEFLQYAWPPKNDYY